MQTVVSIPSEKLPQALALVRASDVDVWLTFVRETSSGGDPILPYFLAGGLTWPSALLITKSGRKIAVLGNYDADPLVASGDWDEVIPYVQGISGALLEVLEREVSPGGRIAVNFSANDEKADGLSHGMFLMLEQILDGTRFEGSLVTAEQIAGDLRGRKSPEEMRRILFAVAQTQELFSELGNYAKIGMSERHLFDWIHERVEQRGFGFSWDPEGDPIVNSGPESMVGHGIPSVSIHLQLGHVFHVDLGLTIDHYSSDLQRCWFVGDAVPSDVSDALHAVNGAISVAAAVLKPGAIAWEIDAAAREYLVGRGYPEYLHATGHQVGRLAHDGGTLLGPRWERYGNSVMGPIKEGEVYTLELGVFLEHRGYLGIEEMVFITEEGASWLSERQWEMGLISS